MPLQLFRELTNPYDEWAIVIKNEKGEKLGYVLRSRNLILARLMDAGKLIYAKVKEVQTEEWNPVKIRSYMRD